ncbi:MAG TPA: SDR family oxidoreductase [Mycobacteriales bacterium]|nr:SDR family oxidoreductase [Mycobacteriales bacterium]
MSTADATKPLTVLVTGGSRGLGAGIVAGYLADGARVATCSRSSTAEVEGWQADPACADRFFYRSFDLADRAAGAGYVKEVIGRFGHIDVLVNNAGVAHADTLALTSDDDIDAVIDLNLKATLNITRAVSRHMLARRCGSIVNISSIVGLSGYRGLSVYSATKAALDGLTRSLARELGSRNIRVNSVAPGYLRTDMSHGLDEQQLGQIVRRTPAGRLGEPADVYAAVRFLASAEAGFITGHTLVIDGGLTA